MKCDCGSVRGEASRWIGVVCWHVVLAGRGWTPTGQRAVLVHPPSVSSVCLSGTCRSVARRSLLSTGCFFAHCLAGVDLLYPRRISFPLFVSLLSLGVFLNIIRNSLVGTTIFRRGRSGNTLVRSMRGRIDSPSPESSLHRRDRT